MPTASTVTLKRVLPIAACASAEHGITELVTHRRTVDCPFFDPWWPVKPLAFLGCFQSWYTEEMAVEVIAWVFLGWFELVGLVWVGLGWLGWLGLFELV